MYDFKKHNLLKYIPNKIPIEEKVNPDRIFDFNNKPIKNGDIIYLCERELRAKDNFSLQFALEKSEELDKTLKIIHPRISFEYKPKQDFINKQIYQTQTAFKKAGLNFEILDFDELLQLKIGIMIIDFNPILKRENFDKFNFKIYEVDSHNIIPARFISNKMEYNAATFRRKVYKTIYPFLTEYPNTFQIECEGDKKLQNFIQDKLDFYSEFKNDVNKNVVSNLSKYMNFGFISPQRVALEVIKSNSSDENKEAFLEELIVRGELSDNFCLYCPNFKTIKCAPKWAKDSLKKHMEDIRPYLYDIKDLEFSKTHDKLWNKAQDSLRQEGKIHGYLRMYWAKKILEWSKTPEIAVKNAIYLNDKYGFDAPSSNGYVGILWSTVGLHDRGFRDWFATGKVRRMTGKTIKF